jgi:ABC-type antimicrobial peptide transport system permease subunit
MESQPKRIKLVAASQPDPFSAVHSDIHDLVIQHFKGNEIKRLAKVSKGWNRIIGGSSAAMKRLVLKVHDVIVFQVSRREVTAMLNSNRNYQHMDLCLNYATNIKRKLMLLSKFSSSLVNLKLGLIVRMEMTFPATLSLPKLESLCAAPITCSVAMKILKDADRLQELSMHLQYERYLWFIDEIDKIVVIDEEFVKMLFKKKMLKKLTLRNRSEDIFSFESFQKPEFKLTSFSIGDYKIVIYNRSFGPVHEISQRNLHAFVLAMADTLTSLDICYFQAVDALLIQKLPALKSLKIGWHQVQRSLASYKPNTSIEVLNFDGISSTPSAFLKSFKNVRSMRISFISKDDFKKILECRPGLLKLEVGNGWMNKQDLEDVYKEVRSVEPSSVESLEVKVGNMKPFVLKM